MLTFNTTPSLYQLVPGTLFFVVCSLDLCGGTATIDTEYRVYSCTCGFIIAFLFFYSKHAKTPLLAILRSGYY